LVRALTSWLDPDRLLALARQTGFLLRQPRKLTPRLLVLATVLLVSQSAVSLRRWAVLVGVLGELSLSKQALWERLTGRAVAFLQAVLAQLLGRRLRLDSTPPPALARFQRVLVQDSTTLALSPRLAAHFPGAANARGDTRGLLKLQVLYDLLSQRFVAFGLSGFRRNDQTAAQDVLPQLRPGDLVLRDLGYFGVENLSRIAQAGAFFLSRLRLDVGLFHSETQRPFNLLGTLKRQGHFDGEVCLGAAARAAGGGETARSRGGRTPPQSQTESRPPLPARRPASGAAGLGDLRDQRAARGLERQNRGAGVWVALAH
jgi:hypothetical protein